MATGRPVTNRYKVPQKMWRTWSDEGQRMFNKLFRAMRHQATVVHPQQVLMPAGQWKTIRWNAAVLAAFEASKLRFIVPKLPRGRAH